MKTAKLVIIRLLIVILTAFFVVQINTVKVIAEDTSNVQFERSITGATGYTFCQTNLLKTPQKNSDVLITIDAGDELETVHMDKKIMGIEITSPSSTFNYALEL